LKKNVEFYDEVFATTEHYQGPPERSPYMPLWYEAINAIRDYLRVLDAGCGPGQFGEVCKRTGHEYLGLDYSPKAIELANKKGWGDYIQVDLEKDHTWIRRGEYDVFTALEFLEHVDKDLEIIEAIPSGRCVVISGPDYLTEEHLRAFSSLDDFRNRYGLYLNWDRGWIISGKNVRGENVSIFLAKGFRR